MAKTRTAKEIADQLEEVRLVKKGLDAEDKRLTKQLLAAMKKEQVGMAGNYKIASRKTLTVRKGSETEAYQWAQDHYALKVDTGDVLDIIKKSLEPAPNFFLVKESEYLTPINRNKENENESE